MEPIPGLPKFLDALYEPDDKFVPGRLTIRYRFEEDGWPGREIERGFVFQYIEKEKKVFFRVYPSLVQYPLGEENSLDKAIELAKQFLNKWLSLDRKNVDFRLSTAREILHLEEEKRKERQQKK